MTLSTGAEQRSVQDGYGVQMKVFTMMCGAKQTHFL